MFDFSFFIITPTYLIYFYVKLYLDEITICLGYKYIWCLLDGKINKQFFVGFLFRRHFIFSIKVHAPWAYEILFSVRKDVFLFK